MSRSFGAAGSATEGGLATQGNQLSCREQERSRSSEEVVPGLSVFPSRVPGVSAVRGAGSVPDDGDGCTIQ